MQVGHVGELGHTGGAAVMNLVRKIVSDRECLLDQVTFRWRFVNSFHLQLQQILDISIQKLPRL